MTEQKKINISTAIKSAESKKEVLKKELEKIAEKEKALATQRSNINQKLAKLDGFISSQQLLLKD